MKTLLQARRFNKTYVTLPWGMMCGPKLRSPRISSSGPGFIPLDRVTRIFDSTWKVLASASCSMMIYKDHEYYKWNGMLLWGMTIGPKWYASLLVKNVYELRTRLHSPLQHCMKCVTGNIMSISAWPICLRYFTGAAGTWLNRRWMCSWGRRNVAWPDVSWACLRLRDEPLGPGIIPFTSHARWKSSARFWDEEYDLLPVHGKCICVQSLRFQRDGT